ncbi:LOW QUALITY PROTEIN: hypothetical protein YC2023_095174 [Brassica napus]
MKERIHHFPFICSQVEMKFDVGGTKRFHRLKMNFFYVPPVKCSSRSATDQGTGTSSLIPTSSEEVVADVFRNKKLRDADRLNIQHVLDGGEYPLPPRYHRLRDTDRLNIRHVSTRVRWGRVSTTSPIPSCSCSDYTTTVDYNCSRVNKCSVPINLMMKMDSVSNVLLNMETISLLGPKHGSQFFLLSPNNLFPVRKLSCFPPKSLPTKPSEYVRLKAMTSPTSNKQSQVHEIAPFSMD